MPDPSPDWIAYVEDWGLLFEESGLPRTAGRIWGWLLICDPPHQALQQLCDALSVSKASASTQTRLLEAHGLLQRVAVPGSRESHYRIRDDAFETLMEQKLQATRCWRALADRGVEAAAETPRVPGERLKELSRFYRFIQEEQEALLARWRTRRGG